MKKKVKKAVTILREKTEAEKLCEALEALRDLHDFCGPPMVERYRARWIAAMAMAVEILEKAGK